MIFVIPEDTELDPALPPTLVHDNDADAMSLPSKLTACPLLVLPMYMSSNLYAGVRLPIFEGLKLIRDPRDNVPV